MKTGQIFLGDISCAFVMTEENIHTVELIVNSFEMYKNITNFFKAKDENKEKVIPYIVGRTNDNRYFLFYDCILKTSYLPFVVTNLFLTFDKCLYTANNVDINMDMVNVEINCIKLKGENIIKFIGYEYFKKYEEILKQAYNFDILYNDNVLNLSCSIDKDEVIHYMDPDSYDIKEKEDKPYIIVQILNSKDINDYFYILNIIDKVLMFCFQKKRYVIQNVLFEYEEYEKVNHKYYLYLKRKNIDTLEDNKLYNLKLDNLGLDIFCKLIQKFNKKDNDETLNLRFLNNIDKKNKPFFENFDDDIITIAQTFENEFNLKYPDYKEKREIKDVLIEVLKNINKILLDEQIGLLLKEKEELLLLNQNFNLLQEKGVKLKELKEFSRKLIPFLELKKSTLSEKIRKIFEDNYDVLPNNIKDYFKFNKENINNFVKKSEHFADVRNKISHGKSYEVKYENSDLYIYFSLVVFIYYFYLCDLGLDNNKLISYLGSFEDLGYFTDGFEKIETDKWLEEYAPLLSKVINNI